MRIRHRGKRLKPHVHQIHSLEGEEWKHLKERRTLENITKQAWETLRHPTLEEVHTVTVNTRSQTFFQLLKPGYTSANWPKSLHRHTLKILLPSLGTKTPYWAKQRSTKTKQKLVVYSLVLKTLTTKGQIFGGIFDLHMCGRRSSAPLHSY